MTFRADATWNSVFVGCFVTEKISVCAAVKKSLIAFIRPFAKRERYGTIGKSIFISDTTPHITSSVKIRPHRPATQMCGIRVRVRFGNMREFHPLKVGNARHCRLNGEVRSKSNHFAYTRKFNQTTDIDFVAKNSVGSISCTFAKIFKIFFVVSCNQL